jgi:xanthine dehydrogenase YagS FAD-binding subunit
MSASVKAEFRAGGTDLSERRRSGVSRGPIIDLAPSADTTAIGWAGNGAARIGAAVTVEAIATDMRLREAYPGLAAAAAGLATPQIRSIGTIGGNLAQRNRCWYYRNSHFSCLKKSGSDCPARAGNHRYHVIFDLGPCVAPHPSTLAAALIAYEATVTTNQRSGLTMAELLGDGSNGTIDNALHEGEAITRVDMPAPLAGERAAYRRAISRTYAEWPLVEVVVRAVTAQDRFVRIAAGGIAPVPLRLERVEQELMAHPIDQAGLRRAAELATLGAKPLPQTGYKVTLLRELVIDLLERVLAA